MSELAIKEIKNAFDKVKLLAKKEYLIGHYETSLKHIETAAEIAYMFNWIYTDEELENLLAAISNAVIPKKNKFSPISGKIVFYDFLALDNRGLTQQYLRALISWGCELLFISERSDLNNSKGILKEIEGYSKAELFVVDNLLTNVEKIKSVYNKIAEFKPEKAFLHLHPASVVAVSIWNAFPNVARYQVNLTDHAFWLGTKCINYSLEFRDYGCNVSYQQRNLSEEKLLIQPFYPIMECQPFIGLPLEIPNDAIKIFTGGTYYKMYGKSGMFFELLKILIEINQKVVILLAGEGNDVPMKQFIYENKYENRIFLLGSRPDITHVFENCDIYLSTYPVTGGLMGQYAANLAKPLLSYTSEDIPCNFSEGFINWNIDSDFKITHTTLDLFKAEALKMIESKDYREKKGEENKKHIITKNEFSIHLKDLVTKNKMDRPFKKVSIDYIAFSNLYIEMENKYLKQFGLFILLRFKFRSVLLFPKQIISFVLLFSNWKLIFNRILKS